jgi:hypothetical protein
MDAFAQPTVFSRGEGLRHAHEYEARAAEQSARLLRLLRFGSAVCVVSSLLWSPACHTH